jgi:formylglycine-generating enzyme required for sulfatase activity
MRANDRARLLSRVGIAACVSLGLFAAGACIPDVEPNVLSLPRCDRVEPICGPAGKDSCCADGLVQGGQFNRVNDNALPALVADFRLDRFEVTVGRFRQFVADYPRNKPAPGDGKHPLVEGSGWNAAWDEKLPADADALRQSLGCDPNYRTWTEAPAANEALPINCVSWYLAFAFCAWDEGRLPTDTEWNYAAAGGNDQRLYPWGSDAPASDPTVDEHAVFGCTSGVGCLIPRVGSKPKGDARWGQSDLAGSLSEWELDFHGYMAPACNNCADLKDEGYGREARGGDFAHEPGGLTTTYRVGFVPESGQTFVGFRCARDK